MKPTFALSIAALLTISACAVGDDDPAASLDDPQGQPQFRKGGGGGGNPPQPPLTTLVSISSTPTPLPGGHPSSGIITLSGPQGNGPGSALVSSNPAVLTVPTEFFAYGTQSVGWFNIVTNPVTVTTPVTITATQVSTGIVRSTTINVVPATAPPVPDTIAVQRARFVFVGGRGGNIEVEATSTNPNAILTVWFLPGNFEGFRLVNTGGGHFALARPTTSSSVPPQIYVKSTFGGQSQVFNL